MKLNELIQTDLNIEINKIKTNSKNIEKGDVFVCIKGANFDRHDFIEEAIENGASIAIVSKDVDVSIPTIKVLDPDKTLIEMLERYYAFNPTDLVNIVDEFNPLEDFKPKTKKYLKKNEKKNVKTKRY